MGENEYTNRDIKTQGRLWTVDEVAAYWRVTPQYIYSLIRTERIRFIPVGRFYRIPDEQVKSGIPTN